MVSKGTPFLSVFSRLSELIDEYFGVFCSLLLLPAVDGRTEGMQRSSPVRVLSRDGLPEFWRSELRSAYITIG